MNKDNHKKTDELIGKLCSDLKPISPCCPYRRIGYWLIGSLIYLSVAVFYLGLRPDIHERLMDGNFLYEMGLGFSLLITSFIASSWLCFPDCIQRDWMKVIAATLFFCFSLWVAAQSIPAGMGLISTLHIGHCAKEGILVEVLPIVALVLITMKGHTTQPYWSMTMNILAVTSLGWLALRLTCSMDEMGHTFYNHLLPFAICGAGLALFARKLFKW